MSAAAPLTVTGAVLDGESVALRCVAGKIAAVGGVLPYPAAREAGVAAPLLTANNTELHQLLTPVGREVDAVRVGGPGDFLLLRAGSAELSLGDLYSDSTF